MKKKSELFTVVCINGTSIPLKHLGTDKEVHFKLPSLVDGLEAYGIEIDLEDVEAAFVYIDLVVLGVCKSLKRRKLKFETIYDEWGTTIIVDNKGQKELFVATIKK